MKTKSNDFLLRLFFTLFTVFANPLFFTNSVLAEVIINENRNFVVDENTLVKIDDVETDATEFESKAEGITATILIADDVNETVTSGTALEILAVNQIKGPVTNLDPLQVFGQNVIITSDTVLANTSGNFAVGELLEVSGSFDDESNLLATRIESKTDIDIWKLLAHVTAVVGDDISFGELTVNISGLALNDCDAGVMVEQLAEIKVNSIANFSIINVIDTLTKFECENGLVDIPDDPASAIIGFELEGFVTNITDATHFELNSQEVEISPTVEYKNGSADDLVLGVKLEAEGTYNTDTLVFLAQKIDFRATRARIEAPITVADLTAEQIVIMGINAKITTLTDDKDNLLPGGLSADTQIEVRGFVDSSGTLLIDEFRERGEPDFVDTRLRGPISNVTANSFEILDVIINSTGATFFDNDDLAISENEFYVALFEGALVDINHASYDSASNTLTGGEFSLEFNVAALKFLKQNLNNSIKGLGTGGIGLGRISSYKAAEVIAPPPPPPPPTSSTSNSGGGSLSILLLILGLGIRLKRRI